MRTILFFDDWPILSRQGIDRRWFPAEPWPNLAPWHDPRLAWSAVSAVLVLSEVEGLVLSEVEGLRDPRTGGWRMWGNGKESVDPSEGDMGVGLCAYASTDGFDWQPLRGDTPSPILFSGEFSGAGAPYFDAREADPARRYKFPYSDLSSNPVDSACGACRVAVSPDGIYWTIDKRAVWRRQHTDTLFSVLFNPYTGKYQWTGRPILGDRRVSLDQTRDWREFEKPQVILHPDPADIPCVEFYGMPQFYYEGYFVGFLWRMWGAPDELVGPSRMQGRVDAELTYSVNGLAWNRTNRQPFLPDRGWGREGFGSEYPCALVLDDAGWLRVYTASVIGEHNDWPKLAPGETIGYLTVSRWRRDGFCALESHSDRGWVLLRGLLPRGGQILLNATTGRLGRIRAELRDIKNQPIPGYELARSVPVTGDGHFLPLRWQDDRGLVETLDPLNGQPFKLFLELDQARVYAVRADADLAYGWVPETNLAGDYIPDRLILP
jgi:hypothetical protein